MNYNTVYSHSADKNLIIPPKSEILRYLGEKGAASDSLTAMIDAHLPRLIDICTPNGSFVLKELRAAPDSVTVGGITYFSHNLSKNLTDCHSAIVFALTVGPGVNRLTDSFSSMPGQAFIISAIGTAIIESYADSFNTEIKKYFVKKSQYLRPRFSPGYGDFALDAQNDIIHMTDASRRCGIYLTKALMLTPTKSVTGIIGISDKDKSCVMSGCEMCDKTDCLSRRNN